MEIVTLEKAKEYLRVEDVDEDDTIAGILSAAEKLCMDVARLSRKEWDDLCKVEESEEEIPVEVRLLTILDIFEALTAKDRPYKKPFAPERAFQILHGMASDGYLDPDILGLFEQSRAWEGI